MSELMGTDVALVPPFPARIGAVWFRHMRVYTRNLFSNALPPFIEPLIFLMGIGLGLGANIGPMQGLPYIRFLAFGLLMTAAMFTAAFEMSYGTYIRLMFDKIYDSMMGAPLTALDIMLGEILWCGTKGAVFTASVLIVCLAFGALPVGWIILSPAIGFLTGLIFAVLALLVTTFVSTISNFNFFFSGLLSPMFFFSGVVFPLSSLPPFLLPVAEALPLTHPVRLVRGFATGFDVIHLWDLAYCALFIGLVGWVAIRRIIRKLVD
jgi:lipooligosaccharide transport system permease protein